MKRVLLTCLIAAALYGCEKRAYLPVTETIFEPGKIKGELDTKELQEISGLAASIINPGLLWAHNDGGDKARIFLIDTTAHQKVVIWLGGDATHRDWEDMAIGPGPEEGKNYIYVGDIGDNDAKHKHKFIYRLEEPKIDPATTSDTTILRVERIKFELPDGARDSECIMIDPVTRDIYLLSKREPKVNLYRLPYPQSTTETITAERVLEKMEFNQYEEKQVSKNGKETLINGYHSSYYNQIVSGEISGDGSEVLIKTYSSVYYWKRPNAENIGDLLKTMPTLLPYTAEPQGEAIAFDVNGKGYYTLSEERGKTPQRLIFYKRK